MRLRKVMCAPVRARGQVPLVRVDKHYALDAAGGSTLEVETTYTVLGSGEVVIDDRRNHAAPMPR